MLLVLVSNPPAVGVYCGPNSWGGGGSAFRGNRNSSIEARMGGLYFQYKPHRVNKTGGVCIRVPAPQSQGLGRHSCSPCPTCPGIGTCHTIDESPTRIGAGNLGLVAADGRERTRYKM